MRKLLFILFMLTAISSSAQTNGDTLPFIQRPCTSSDTNKAFIFTKSNTDINDTNSLIIFPFYTESSYDIEVQVFRNGTDTTYSIGNEMYYDGISGGWQAQKGDSVIVYTTDFNGNCKNGIRSKSVNYVVY